MTQALLKLFSFSLVLLLFSCTDNLEEEIFIDPVLEEYFSRFEAEALERGIIVNLANARVEGHILNIPQQGVIGQCHFDHRDPNKVIVDRIRWGTSDEMRREFVVFHELGHCYLNRIHLNEVNEDGTCASMMHASTAVCDGNYTEETRETYLDELFYQ